MSSAGFPLDVLPSGVPGLDEVLGGGFPKWSLNLIAGAPGTGKTTLAQQIVFANATPERPAIYFTVIGEPPLKLLRYQQQMAFFDPGKLNEAIRFVNLDQQLAEGGVEAALKEIQRQLQAVNPAIVVTDSFRAMTRRLLRGDGDVEGYQSFVEDLAAMLTAWQATTFLVGEYPEREIYESPVPTIADGIIALAQSVQGNSSVRKLQVVKMRGQSPMPGLHTFRITAQGIEVFPRIPTREGAVERPVPRRRVSSGIAGLDEMLGGGIPEGDAVLVAGGSGTGKSVLAVQFAAEGVKRGEPAVVTVFEEHPDEYITRAKELGVDLRAMVDRGLLRMSYLRPLDLSVDETLKEIRAAVQEIGARRVVIDSISGFELALAPTFRDEFRESLYRLVSALTALGVTVLMTIEVWESYTELRFSPQMISFLADDIIALRYVELAGQLRRVIAVAKMRSSQHSKHLRLYEISGSGVEVGEPLEAYRGITTGRPEPAALREPAAYPGLIDREILTLRALARLGQATDTAIAGATGLQVPYARHALERLVDLDYATAAQERGETVYRPTAG